jgi:hypothetical protein
LGTNKKIVQNKNKDNMKYKVKILNYLLICVFCFVPGCSKETPTNNTIDTYILYPPQLASPVSGSTNIPINVTLFWLSADGAGSYALQVSTSSSFTYLVYDVNNITSTNHAVSNLNTGTKYYWRVKSSSSEGSSPFSGIWFFTTVNSK